MKRFVTHVDKGCEFWIRAAFVLANTQAHTGAKAGEWAACCKL